MSYIIFKKLTTIEIEQTGCALILAIDIPARSLSSWQPAANFFHSINPCILPLKFFIFLALNYKSSCLTHLVSFSIVLCLFQFSRIGLGEANGNDSGQVEWTGSCSESANAWLFLRVCDAVFIIRLRVYLGLNELVCICACQTILLAPRNC